MPALPRRSIALTVWLACGLGLGAAMPGPAAAQVPADLLGEWDVSREACGQSFAYSTTKIAIFEDLLDFHYGSAEIVETEARGDALFLRGALTQEGSVAPGPETAFYRIDHAPGSDRLTWTWQGLEPVDMIRCARDETAENGAAEALPLETGLYVLAGSGCAAPANAGTRVYDGTGISGSATRDCRAEILSREGDRFELSQSCIDTYDGQRRYARQVLTVLARDRFRQAEDGEAAQTFALCPDAPFPGEARAAPASRYTTLDLAACDLMDSTAEGTGSTLRCPGDRGEPLFVKMGDLRYTFHVGALNDGFLGGLPFNTPGETVEWRYDRQGALSAVILRYRYDAGPDLTIPSDLAVIRPASDAGRSCTVAFVPPDAAPSQNAAARAIADSIDGRACLDGR